MSATVDSRVVEMHFDNSDFMNKISETIDSLEKLNSQIDKLNSSKGLSDGLDSKNVSGLSSALDSIKYRLSTIGVVGASVTERLTNEAINSVARVGSGITAVFNQIKQGGFQRAKNIEQANFLLEGLGANVEKVMEDVNYAVDGTAYGLDEAAKAAAVFFASGVKQGNGMKTALRGISGVAAMTGKSYEEVSNIFADAAAKGGLYTMELRRLQQTGIAADQFMIKFFNDVNDGKITVSDAIKQNVEELTHGAKVSGDELEKMLRNGDIEFATFAKAMDSAFGKHAQDANKTFSGSLANVKTALSRLGEAFITPAMKAAIPVFNATRKAISSFTTELKDCDFFAASWNENLMTVSKALTLIIYKARDAGIIREMAYVLVNVYHILANVLDNVGEAFGKAFDIKDSYSFIAIAESIENFNHKLEKLIDMTENMERLQKVFHIFFSLVGIGINILTGFAKVIKTVITSIMNFDNESGSLLDFFVNLVDAINSKTGATKVFELFSRVVEAAGERIKKGINFIKNLFGDFFSGFTDGIKNIKSFEQAMMVVSAFIAGQFYLRTFKFPLDELKKDMALLQNFFDPSTRSGVLGSFAEFLKMPEKVTKVLGSTIDLLKAMTYEVDAKILKHIAISVLALAVALKILSGIDAEGLGNALKAVTSVLAEMGIMLFIIQDIAAASSSDSFKGLIAIGSISNALIKIAVALLIMAVAIKMLSSIDINGLAKGTGTIIVMFGIIFGFLVGLDKLLSKESKLSTQITAMSTAMIGIAIAINIMANAVKKLADLNMEQLGKGLGSITVLMGVIWLFLVGMSKFGETSSAGLFAAGAGMVLIATSINILVPAIEKLGNMDLNTLAQGISAMGASLLALAVASQFMSVSGSAGILVASIAMMALASALKTIGSLDMEQIKTALIGIAGALALFMAVGTIVAIFPQVAAGLAIVSAAILAFGVAVALAGAGVAMLGVGLTSIATAISSFAVLTNGAVAIFARTIVQIIKVVVGLFPTIAAELAKAIVQFIETIAELAPQLRAALSIIVTEALGIFTDNIPRIINIGRKFLLGFLEGLAKDIPKITKSIIKIVTGIIDGFAEMQSKIIESGINLMLAFINGLADGVRKHKDDIRDAIVNLCEALLEAFCTFFGIASPSKVMQKQGKNIIQGLINGLKSLGGKVIETFKKGLGKALDYVKALPSKFKNAAIKIITAFVSGIKSKIHDIKTTISKGVENAWNTVKGFVSKFKTAGGNLVSGVARGIRNGLSSVISAVGSIARQALASFKKKLGISSPSKEFAKLGIYIPEGIVIGIKKASNGVKSAVQSMAEGSLDSMKSIMNNATDIIDASYDPKISPVLDLSDVKNKASQIDGLLGRHSLNMAYSTGSMASAMNQNDQYANMLNRLNDAFKTYSGKKVEVINNITVDGAENPEAFANRFVRQLQLEMRTG